MRPAEDILMARDDRGIGILDPADRRGFKNAYIDHVQKLAIERAVEFLGSETVLDYGCGPGRLADWLGERTGRVVGIDRDGRLLEMALRGGNRSNVSFVQVDPGGMPFADACADLVVCAGLLSLLSPPEIDALLADIMRVLKPGGHVLCVDRIPSRAPHRYSLADFVRFASSRGLETVVRRPIRKGRWLALYLVRFGILPERFWGLLARTEQRALYTRPAPGNYYQYLFYWRRP